MLCQKLCWVVQRHYLPSSLDKPAWWDLLSHRGEREARSDSFSTCSKWWCSLAKREPVLAAPVRNPSAASCGNTDSSCLKQYRHLLLLTAEHPSPVFFTFLFCHPRCWHHPQGDRKMAALPDRSSSKSKNNVCGSTFGRRLPVVSQARIRSRVLSKTSPWQGEPQQPCRGRWRGRVRQRVLLITPSDLFSPGTSCSGL